MKKILSYSIILAAMLTFTASAVYSQNYFADTVWTKVTDQMDGFWKVKFSNNDSIIVGNGYEYTIFYNSLNGEEITRFLGKSSIFFIDNDNKFIRTDASRKKYEIYDTKTLQLIDTLVNDGISSSASIDISKDDKYLLTNIPYGFRIFDLETKQILRTRIFPNEPNLIYSVVDYVFFVCDNRNFIAHRVRTYEDPNHPGDDKYYKTYGDYSLYDFNSFDSIGTFINARGMQRSNNCMYYAVATGDPTYGVEIYDFNTKLLFHKLPINGPSLTGIEFSPDDKYIVTSNGPGANSLIIWEVATGNEIHRYWPSSYSAFDVSHNGLFILGVYGRRLRYFHARFSGTSIPEIPTEIKYLYPNPTTGEVILNTDFSGKIKLFDINGNSQKELVPIQIDNGIRFNISELPNGEYLMVLDGIETETYKLIINK